LSKEKIYDLIGDSCNDIARTIEQAVLAKLTAPVTAKPQSAKVDELVNDIEVIANLISNSIDITVVKRMANRALAKFRGNDNE
jgi:hypothetical protein